MADRRLSSTNPPRGLSRRELLLALAGAMSGAWLGCAGAPVESAKPPLVPLAVTDLRSLIARAGLRWVLLTQPRAIAQIPWLIPLIGKLVPEKNFAAYKERSGLDLRQITEALVADYDDSGRLFLVRHNERAGELETRFRARLTSDIVRAEDRQDLVRISGKVGRGPRAFARLGPDVAAYQTNGDLRRGQVRIATLYAQDKLKAPRALGVPPLSDLLTRFGQVPLSFVTLGPFSEEWHHGARGLLEIATAIGLAVRPSARENLLLSIALTGEFGDAASDAADTLRDAYDDLSQTSTGRLLGLDQPVERPVVAGARDVITLAVELSPARMTEALVALFSSDIEALMKIKTSP